MKRLCAWLAAASIALAGCSNKDPRQSQVEIHSESLAASGFVQQGISFWSRATNGDVDMEVVDSCSDDRACIKVYVAEGTELSKHGWWGRTTVTEDIDGPQPTIIKVDPGGLQYAPVEIIAHELGHALGLGHVENTAQEANEPYNGQLDFELMRPTTSSQAGCMNPATGLLYQQTWGTRPIIGVCVGMDGYRWYNQDPKNSTFVIDPD